MIKVLKEARKWKIIKRHEESVLSSNAKNLLIANMARITKLTRKSKFKGQMRKMLSSACNPVHLSSLLPWLKDNLTRMSALCHCSPPHSSLHYDVMYYRKSSIKPPRGAFFFQALGFLRGGLFNLAKRITCSKNTVVWDRVDLRIVQLKSPSKVFNSLVGA